MTGWLPFDYDLTTVMHMDLAFTECLACRRERRAYAKHSDPDRARLLNPQTGIRHDTPTLGVKFYEITSPPSL
jgi:hypothetical protein